MEQWTTVRRVRQAWSVPAMRCLVSSRHVNEVSFIQSISESQLMREQCLANDVQLAALNDAFRRTHYPSTKERQELARQLGMTSRSVQIWVRFFPLSLCAVESLSDISCSSKIVVGRSKLTKNRPSNSPKQKHGPPKQKHGPPKLRGEDCRRLHS